MYVPQPLNERRVQDFDFPWLEVMKSVDWVSNYLTVGALWTVIIGSTVIIKDLLDVLVHLFLQALPSGGGHY
jgi:hypothetical protein